MFAGQYQSATIGNITNDGTIKGNNGIKLQTGKWGGTITAGNITNNGTIEGSDSIVLQTGDWGGTITVGDITNNGIIKGNNNHGIKLDTDVGDGKITAGDITNNGTIYSNTNDVISINKATVNNLSNSGRIESTAQGNGATGIHFYAVNFKTIENQENGIIKSNGKGIELSFFNGKATQGTLVKNAGTIDSRDSAILLYAGTNLQTIDNTGFIQTGNNGIELFDVGWGTNASIHVNTINNSGTIIASKDGIVFRDTRTNANLSAMTIDNINNTGTIQAGRYGIILSDTKNSYQIGKIDIDGLVYGGVAGFYIGAKQKLTEDIIVKGTLAGGQAGIINNGIIGDSKNPDKGGIKLQDGGLILASNSMLSDDTI
ncbi:TPA: hypothetical protein SCV07_001562, partial [Campylobacter lari]|nr:hypothetical protein [Campylobacter lari]